MVLALLPLDCVKTQMQTKGVTLFRACSHLFAQGPAHGVRNLYRGALPAVSEVMLNRGLMFGVGAVFKRSTPHTWPEPLRDAVSGASAALTKTMVLHPVDTIKTRWQLQQAHRELRIMELYQGLAPAATRSALGMAIWLTSRNALERRLPPTMTDDPISGVDYPKHFICGAASSVLVDLTTFPFDTLKKRLQASQGPRGLLQEIRNLYDQEGVGRFYRGYSARLAMVAVNGALFNAVFVRLRRAVGAVYT